MNVLLNFRIDQVFSEAAAKGWRRMPAKVFLREVDVRSETGDEEVLGLSKSLGVQRRAEFSQRASEAASYVGYKRVKSGQLISNKMQAWNGIFGISPYDGITSPDYAVYEFNNCVEPRFVEYVLRTELYAGEFLCRSRGMGTGFLRLNPGEFLSTPVWLPNSREQRAIVDFLDRETTRIDQLIEKKQRLVGILGQKQAAEIDALLHGRHVESKRKSVNSCKFLESIPALWTMRRLKTLCSHLGNGFVGPTRDILIDENAKGATPYLQSTHIKDRRIDFYRKPYFVNKDWLSGNPKCRVRKNDILIVQTGDCGASAIVDEAFEGCGCHALIIARPIVREIEPRLLLHLLSSAYGHSKLASIQTGALHPHLEVGFVKDVSLPIPPRDEQGALVQHIDRISERLDACVKAAVLSIERLQEFRSALISAAVTGQIDVTTWGRRGETDQRLDAIEAKTAVPAQPERKQARA